MRYEVTKDIETGNISIDREHKELFDAVNRLLDACANGKGRKEVSETIKFLNDYVYKHFDHENQLQKQHSYPNMVAHYRFHEDYKAKLFEIINPISTREATVMDLSKINSHVAALIAHIKSEDKKLAQFLNNK